MQYFLQDYTFLGIKNAERHGGLAQVKMQLLGLNIAGNL